MAHAPPERYIPLRCGQLVERLCADAQLVPDGPAFRRVARLLEHHVHHAFGARQRRLKHAWRPFDDDHVRRHGRADEAEQSAAAAALATELDDLLTKANYERVREDEIEQSLSERPIDIGLRVDLADFEELVVYRRGRRVLRETRRRWLFWTREVDVPVYERVCLFVRFRSAAELAARGRRDLAFDPGDVCLKLFHTIPQHDIETLFPNAEVRLRTLDRWLLGLPAAAGMVHFLLFKGAALVTIGVALLVLLGMWEGKPPDMNEALAALVTLGLLLAYLFRHWNNFKSRKIRFLQLLSDRLYYRKLDNGIGVVFHLLDSAEEAEVKEALLAWVILARAERPLSVEEMDARAEAWLAEQTGCAVDFEERDAMAKLVDFGLVREVSDGRWEALDAADAETRLRDLWARRGDEPTDASG